MLVPPARPDSRSMVTRRPASIARDLRLADRAVRVPADIQRIHRETQPCGNLGDLGPWPPAWHASALPTDYGSIWDGTPPSDVLRSCGDAEAEAVVGRIRGLVAVEHRLLLESLEQPAEARGLSSRTSGSPRGRGGRAGRSRRRTGCTTRASSLTRARIGPWLASVHDSGRAQLLPARDGPKCVRDAGEQGPMSSWGPVQARGKLWGAIAFEAATRGQESLRVREALA